MNGKGRMQLPLIGLSALLVTLVGCVEIPDTGPPIPDYQSEFRFIYLDPSLPTSSISLAEGSSTAFRELPPGTYGIASGYTTFPSGAKRMFIKSGGVPIDPDTSVVSFAPDQRGGVVVVPRQTGVSRFLVLGERYVFAAPGKNDSTLVRFVNGVAGGDTIDVRRIAGTAGVVSILADNLRFGRSSPLFSIAAGETVRFFVTRATGSSAGVSDTLVVNAVSRKQFTIVAYDSISRLQFVSFEDN
jgi:hypothetical protein